MPELWIPENITDATEEYVDPAQAAFDTVAAREFERELRRVDSRLGLLFAKPGAKAFPKGGRWYIYRRNEMANDAYWMLEDEQGNYSAPTARHMQRFREGDAATNPELWRKFKRSYDDRVKRAEKAMDEKRREFREKLLERLDHNHGTTIHVTGPMREKLPDA